MSWLVTRAGIVWFLLIGLIGGSRLVGHQQPTPDRLALLQLDYCKLPCWIGIVPGKTRFTEAKSVLMQYFEGAQFTDAEDRLTLSTVLYDQARGITILVGTGSSRIMGDNNPPVETILVYYQDASAPDFSLGTLLNVVGRPTSVSLITGVAGQSSLIYFGNEHLVLDTLGQMGRSPCIPVAANLRLRGIQIYDKMIKPESELPWRGFISCYRIK